jgi:hypothetical protein
VDTGGASPADGLEGSVAGIDCELSIRHRADKVLPDHNASPIAIAQILKHRFVISISILLSLSFTRNRDRSRAGPRRDSVPYARSLGPSGFL